VLGSPIIVDNKKNGRLEAVYTMKGTPPHQQTDGKKSEGYITHREKSTCLHSHFKKEEKKSIHYVLALLAKAQGEE